MTTISPEWFLTSAERARKAEIEDEARGLKARHTELVQKMKMPRGLDDEEILELRKVIESFDKLWNEHQSLLAKNPMLAENILKNIGVS